jgi:hypothetical protein
MKEGEWVGVEMREYILNKFFEYFGHRKERVVGSWVLWLENFIFGIFGKCGVRWLINRISFEVNQDLLIFGLDLMISSRESLLDEVLLVLEDKNVDRVFNRESQLILLNIISWYCEHRKKDIVGFERRIGSVVEKYVNSSEKEFRRVGFSILYYVDESPMRLFEGSEWE